MRRKLWSALVLSSVTGIAGCNGLPAPPAPPTIEQGAPDVYSSPHAPPPASGQPYYDNFPDHAPR